MSTTRLDDEHVEPEGAAPQRGEPLPLVAQPRRIIAEFISRILKHEKLEVNGIPIKTVASNIRSLVVPWHEFSFDPRGRGFEGDILLGQVVQAGGSTSKIENIFGRDEVLFAGDHIIAVLGNRHSGTSEYGGILPEGWDAGKKPVADLLCHGGILGEVEDIPRHMRQQPTKIAIKGWVKYNGKNVNTKDFFPEWEKNLSPSAPIVLVCGTSAESGKTTTAAALIQALKFFGYRVAGTKLTGTGRYRDLLALRDAGADIFFDFPDVGLPSTYTSRERFLPALRTLLNKLNREYPDVIVGELGGDLIEANIPALFDDADFLKNVKKILVVANDVIGMKGALDILAEWAPAVPCHLALPKDRNKKGTVKRMESFLQRPSFDSLNFDEVQAMVNTWRGAILTENPHAELYHKPRDLETRVQTFSRFLELMEPNPADIDSMIGPLQGKKILDLGCGTGTPLLRIGPTFQDANLDIVGLDTSAGVLASLQAKYPHARCMLGSAEHIPSESESFDLILVRHMLYHVGNIHAALREMRRVLKPDGLCIITTNGEKNRPELWSIHERAVAEIPGAAFVPSGARRFSAENGTSQLALHFEDIHTIPWRGHMKFMDASDIMDYYTSTPYFQQTSADASTREEIFSHVASAIRRIIEEKGEFCLSNEGAIFIVRKRKVPENIVFNPDHPEYTADEVRAKLASQTWMIVDNFPCDPHQLFSFASLLGTPMLKHSYGGGTVGAMSSVGDIRFRPDVADDKRMPTQGCGAIALHTAHSYSSVRPRYFALLMADPGWREKAGKNGESLLLDWGTALREYGKHFPDSAEEDINLLMNTSVPYAPWYVHEPAAHEPLFQRSADGTIEVRYWENIVSTVLDLMLAGRILKNEALLGVLRRFDDFIQRSAARKEFCMEKGQLLVLDNKKAAHGRRPFVGFLDEDKRKVNPRQLYSLHILENPAG